MRRTPRGSWARKVLSYRLQPWCENVPADTFDKLCKMFAFLDDLDDLEELRSLVAWKVHVFSGDQRNVEHERDSKPAFDVPHRYVGA